MNFSRNHIDAFGKQLRKPNAKIYSPEELDFIIDLLERYNGYVKSNINLTPPDLNGEFITPHDISVIQSDSFTTPVFHSSLLSGGRLLTSQGYQNISKESRSHCQINSKPTTGIDMTAAAMQFLLIITEEKGLGTNSTARNLNSEDPYQSILDNLLSELQGITITRPEVKKCVIGIIHGSKPSKNISPQDKRRENILETLKNNQAAQKICEYLMGGLVELINKIESETGFPINIQILKSEAEFLYAVLDELMTKKIHCLPMHDAYITPTSQADTTRKVLDLISQSKYSKSLHFHEGF